MSLPLTSHPLKVSSAGFLCYPVFFLSFVVSTGELKVLVIRLPGGKYAALRLRDGDNDSCLWKLRCDDLELRITIKRLLEDV